MRILLLLGCVMLAGNLFATNYYVDYSSGSDGNNGTSKSTPWKRAPGMYTASGTAAAQTINPGDSIILKGCVTWPNAVFPWAPKFSGSSGNPVYIGVDKTWWDSTVPGCSTAWNRPIMNPQGATTDPGATGVEILMDNRAASYITWDNFEVINWYTYPDTSSGSNEAFVFFVSSASHGASNNTIENMYVHHWINPYISIGTGNLASGSCTITNYVPYSYSPSPASSWVSVPGGLNVQSLPQGADIPEGNNSPVVTAITGSNPYTVTFTNTSGCPANGHTAAVIQIGIDAGVVVGGNSAGDTGTVVTNNVFDGSDTAEVAWNPYGDCGASEGNNRACLASVEVGRQGPQIWRNNVMRYVSNGFIGSSSEMSGNLLEYFRIGLNPTGHTNVWEDQPCLGKACLYFNNVIRHMNSVNSSIPGGFVNIGVPLMVAPSSSNSTAYVFNNVLYDMTQNTVIEINSMEGLVGTIALWNNTIQGGPDAGASYGVFSCTVPHCIVQNNHAITTAGAPFGTCGSGCTQTTNVSMTPTAATADGYAISQTYALSPTSASSPTVGSGTNAKSLCTTLSGINSAAGTACQSDTPYAVGYDTSNHTVMIPNRTINTQPQSGAWNVGVYLLGSGGNGPQPPTGLAAVVQ